MGELRLVGSPEDRPDPWERQDGETPLDFLAFRVFRDLGPARSRGRTAVQVERSIGAITTLARRWDWDARAAAWDDEEDRVFLAERRSAQRSAARRHQALADRMLTVVEGKLNTMMLALNDPEGEGGVNIVPADLVRWAEAAVKIERLAIGAPDLKAVAVTGAALGTAPTSTEADDIRAALSNPDTMDLAMQLLERVALPVGQTPVEP